MSSQAAQAVFTSHCPAILGRIDPTEVRHFRLNWKHRTTIIREVKLPDAAEEAAKYVREAVVAYPELYFARFAILTEGASEQIVIPRLASALALDVDPAFVAVIPLGGRHVNYFWKLLSDLDIPYATLLDLDLGRDGGGWGRIKYACEQLLAVGVNRDQLLTVRFEKGTTRVLSEKEFERLHTWDRKSISSLNGWMRRLENLGVFFSSPLDLDMSMLSQFPEAYKAIATPGHGPRIPPIDEPAYSETIENAAKAVLGDMEPDPSVYPDALQGLFPWYRYLFVYKSKPSMHLLALSEIDDEELVSKAPAVLKRLVNHVDAQLPTRITRGP